MSEINIANILKGLVNFAFGLAALGLVARFFFRLFGANPAADFTEFVYESTAPLLDPFRYVFLPYVIEPGNVIEFSTIIALVFYLIVAYLLIALIDFVEQRSVEYKQNH
jgi:uncharacterized protein YggT (Ycf19 family)